MITSDIDTKKIAEIPVPTLREIADYMREWLPKIQNHLRTEDEKELAAAKARVAEIEARIGISKPILLGAAAVPTEVAIKLTAMKDHPEGWAETDAGMGIGRDARPSATSLDDIRAEQAALRQHNVEKRRRRGFA